MYLTVGSRPDIVFSVGKVGRLCGKPQMKHWIAVKRVFRYFSGNRKMGEDYYQICGESVFGYSDSDSGW